MTLSRSTNAQQASIAIQTLSQIIKNERLGKFIGCFFHAVNILDELLDADIMSVLRISLDNHHSPVLMDASLQALSEIFYVELEENALDYNFFQSTFHGHLSPSLYSKLIQDKDFKEEASELKDIQIMKADLILGLLRTNFLQRISYLISSSKLNNSGILTINNMLKILIRCSRHSLSLANQLVSKHASLLKMILENYLPMTSVLLDHPNHYALKLFRCLMAWGRNIAKIILEDYQLGPRILCYLSLEPEMSPIIQESLRLIVEAGRTWITCLRFGLGINLLTDYFPVMMKHLIFWNTHLSITDDDKASKFNYHFAVVILEVVNAGIYCAPNTEEKFIEVDKNATCLMDWSALTTIMESVEICFKKWLVEMSRLESLTLFSWDLMASIMSLYSSFLKVGMKSKTFDLVHFVQKMQDLIDFTQILFQCQPLKKLLTNMTKQSFFKLKTMTDGRSRDPSNLPSLGLVSFIQDQVHYMFKNESVFVYLSSFLDLILSGKSLKIQGLEQFLCCQYFKEYLSLVSTNVANLKGSRSNWFCRSEINFLHQLLVSLVTFKTSVDQDCILRSAMTLLTHYQISDSIKAEWLMNHIIFHPDYIGPNLLSSVMANVQVSSSQEDNLSTNLDLLNLKQVYFKIIFKNKDDHEHSQILQSQCAFSMPSLVLNNHGETLLPGDWQYLPLLQLLSNQKSDLATLLDLKNVISCLSWTVIMNNIIGIKNPVFAYSRLATVFLAASDLFLDSQVKSLIKICLNDILQKDKKLIFKKANIPGLDSFEEFFKELVQQFQAVSYGDSLFAQVILLPLIKGNDLKLSYILWNDHMEALRSITLKNQDLLGKLGIEDFVHENIDSELAKVYVKAVTSKNIMASRNPLLFSIAKANIEAASVKDEQLNLEVKKLAIF